MCYMHFYLVYRKVNLKGKGEVNILICDYLNRSFLQLS